MKTNKIDKKEFTLAKMHYCLTPAEAIKMVRELQGLSQNALAEMSGISQPNISSLENGTRQLGRERAIALAEALKVHPAVLLFPDFDMSKVA